MFVPFWLIFLITGQVMAVAVLFWSIRNRQFEDQDRARYLPLVGLSERELAARPPVRRGASFYAIMMIFISGMLMLGISIYICAGGPWPQ